MKNQNRVRPDSKAEASQKQPQPGDKTGEPAQPSPIKIVLDFAAAEAEKQPLRKQALLYRCLAVIPGNEQKSWYFSKWADQAEGKLTASAAGDDFLDSLATLGGVDRVRLTCLVPTNVAWYIARFSALTGLTLEDAMSVLFEEQSAEVVEHIEELITERAKK